jgi:hypothetical protein
MQALSIYTGVVSASLSFDAPSLGRECGTPILYKLLIIPAG